MVVNLNNLAILVLMLMMKFIFKLLEIIMLNNLKFVNVLLIKKILLKIMLEIMKLNLLKLVLK